MKRIFVLGRERSGTKWLTNLIANHESISCIQAPEHSGVLETNMLGRTEQAFGDLNVFENRTAFIHCFKQMTFFRLTGLPESFLIDHPSRDYTQIFVDMMDQFAKNNGSTGWVQKANSLNAEKIRREIPDAKLVFIQRDPLGNLLSKTLRKPEKSGWLNDLQHLFGYMYAIKHENRFCQRHAALKVQFQNLQSDKESTLREVCEFVGLDYSDAMLIERFKKNTTFANSKKPELTSAEKSRKRLLCQFVAAIPFPIIKLIRNRYRKGRDEINRFGKGCFEP